MRHRHWAPLSPPACGSAPAPGLPVLELPWPRTTVPVPLHSGVDQSRDDARAGAGISDRQAGGQRQRPAGLSLEMAYGCAAGGHAPGAGGPQRPVAVGVELGELAVDVDGVGAAGRATSVAGTPEFSHSDTAVCRRS